MAQQINLDRSQRLDITCKRNDTFKLNLELKNESGVAIDLTNGGYSFKMQVRAEDLHDTDAVESDSDPEGYYLSMDGSNSVGTTGLVTFSTVASAMNLDSGIYVYDIQRTIDTDVETLLYGVFKVNEDITI